MDQEFISTSLVLKCMDRDPTAISVSELFLASPGQTPPEKTFYKKESKVSGDHLGGRSYA